jgi:hypothetical protein
MSTRSVWALIFALVALTGAYWLVVSGEDRDARHDEEVRRLLGVSADSVTALTLTRLDEPPVRAVRSETGWDIVAPLDGIPANQGVWNRLAEQAQELKRERTVAEKAEDLAPYGLSAPVLELDVEGQNGETHRISFGELEPTRTHRYTLVEGDAVVLVSDRVYREFDRSLYDLRERHLVELGDEGVTWLRYVRLRPVEEPAAGDAPLLGPEQEAAAEESLAIVVERDAQGVWRLVEPLEAAADQELVAALITEVQYVTARSFVDTPTALADYGLNPPGARLSVRSGAGPVQTFSLGWIASATEKEEGGLYAMREGYPSVYLLDGHILTLLPKGPYSFRDHRLFTGAATDIAQIRYRSHDEEFILRNDPDQGWQVGRVDEGVPRWLEDVDQAAVSAFIGALKVVGVASFEEESAASGLDAPLVTVSIEMEDSTERVITIGAETSDLAGSPQYFVRQDTGATGKIGAFQKGLLTKSPDDFRDKHLLGFEAGDVTGISVQVDGVSYQLKKEADAWRLQAPEERILSDASPVNALLQRLQEAEVSDVVATEADTPTGLDAPVLEVTLTTAAGATVGPAQVGGVAGEGQRYANTAGRSEVFTVEQDLLEGIRDAVFGLRAPAE